MKKTLTLGKLQVSSFVTHLNNQVTKTIRGGLDTYESNNSFSDVCAKSGYPGCILGDPIIVRCDGHTNPQDCVGGDNQQNSLNNCNHE